MATRKKVDFEASLKELEAIIESLEDGNPGLEQSLKSFEKGVKITKDCQKELEKAKQRVEIISGEGDEFTTDDFDTGETE